MSATPDPHLIIALFHIFAVVPFLLYVALQRTSVPVWIYWIVLVLGILITVYHGAKGALRWITKSPGIWISAIHAIYLGPLLIYIGWKKYDTPRPAYEVLTLFAFAALGYHFLTVANLASSSSA